MTSSKTVVNSVRSPAYLSRRIFKKSYKSTQSLSETHHLTFSVGGIITYQGHLWSQQSGLYLGIDQNQLRFFTTEGRLVPTPEETAERLAAKLLELHIDPDTV